MHDKERGTIDGLPEYIGTVFQEDRLCEEYDVIANIMLTMKSENHLKEKHKKGSDTKNIKLVVSTHREEDMNLLDAVQIKLRGGKIL